MVWSPHPRWALSTKLVRLGAGGFVNGAFIH